MHVEYTGEGASQLESDSYSLAASFCCLERFTIAGKGPAVEAFPRWPLDVAGGWLSTLSMLVAAEAHEKFTRELSDTSLESHRRDCGEGKGRRTVEPTGIGGV
jgi:hypothetical protein